MKKVLLTALAYTVATAAALADMAYPFPEELTQPDGTAVTLRLVGDEFLHFTVTDDGYSVVKNADGYYTYAQKVDGQLLATDIVAHNPASRTPAELQYLEGVTKYIAPDMDEEAEQMRSELRSMTSARPKLHGYSQLDLSSFRGLIILVEYNDCTFSRSDISTIFNNMVNEQNYAGVPSEDGTSVTSYTGSMRDYFYDASSGTFDPTFDIVGPVTIDYSMNDANSSSNGRTLAKAACNAADDLVNFADYDRNGDGIVDMVYFIYAGYAANYTGNDASLLWPHASAISNFYLDGVKIYRYACSTELYGLSTSTTKTLCGIGTMCHEFSHVLCLPDLYDTDYDSSGGTSNHPKYWSVMASGSHLNKGRTPPTYSLYERYAVGFATPEVITEAGEYTLEALLTSNKGYRIDSSVEDEYFLIENRQQDDWDAKLYGHGMLVWRVDSTDVDVWEDNDVNCNPDHNYYELVRANPSTASDGTITDSGGDPFPGTADVTDLTNETTPDICSWTGAKTPFVLKNIAESDDGIIYFTVIADDNITTVEDFEDMPTFTTDTTDVAGVFAQWDFENAYVVECSSSTGLDSHAVAIYYGGSLTSSTITAQSIDSISLRLWNPNFRTATLHLYTSADGGTTWTEHYESGATEASTVAMSSSNVTHSYPIEATGASLMVRIYIDGNLGSTARLTLDNVKLYYKGTLGLAGAGTEASPYEISTVEQWNSMAQYIAINQDAMTGKYVSLLSDLDFTGTEIVPFGYDRTTAFDGNFNGNSKTISGISATADASYYGCAFTQVGTSGVVRNLVVKGTLSASYSYSAGVVGRLAGTLDNVVGCVDVTSTVAYCAGLVGYATSNAALNGCVNRGSVTYSGSSSTSYTAGVIAYSYPCTLTGCGNEGTLTATGSSAGGFAGVIARAYATSSSSSFSLTGCYNTGSITSTGGNAGIVLAGASAVKMSLTGCYNTGSITSTSDTEVSGAYTAGISATYFRSSTYSGCWNSGTITAGASPYAAGLLGYVVGSSFGSSVSESSTTTISGCTNYSTVTSGGKYAGGIIAYMANYVDIDSCGNTATITAAGGYAGGVAGYINGDDSSISNSWNSGAVTVESSFAGGVAGYIAGEAPVSGCFSVGNISAATGNAGSIAGYSAGQFTNVYGTGVISGSGNVGGIVGCPLAGSTTVNVAYFGGELSAEEGTCGNIIGVDLVDNSTYWTSGNSITGTYYIDRGLTCCSDTSSTGLTMAQLATLDLGDGWTAGDDYTYPRLTALADNDFARAFAAAVIPNGTDTYGNITGAFNVGTPDGVVWTPSASAVSVSYNRAWFTEAYSGSLTMLATAGNASAATGLTCNVTQADGIEAVDEDGRRVVDEVFFTPDGLRVAAPAGDTRSVYIIVKTYDDGTTTVAKETR